jgi:hypothetical protein
VLLALGAACCLVSWSTWIFPSVGPMINRIDGLRVPLLLYFWVQSWAALIGPVFTGMAMWKGPGVTRISGGLLLLMQSPMLLASVLWILKI